MFCGLGEEECTKIRKKKKGKRKKEKNLIAAKRGLYILTAMDPFFQLHI